MKLPKFKIGQKVICFFSSNYYEGTIRGVSVRDIWDLTSDRYEYTVLYDCGDSSIVFEEQITTEPLTKEEAARCKAEMLLSKLKAAAKAEKETIRRLETELNARKENWLKSETYKDRLENKIKEAK